MGHPVLWTHNPNTRYEHSTSQMQVYTRAALYSSVQHALSTFALPPTIANTTQHALSLVSRRLSCWTLVLYATFLSRMFDAVLLCMFIFAVCYIVWRKDPLVHSAFNRFRVSFCRVQRRNLSCDPYVTFHWRITREISGHEKLVDTNLLYTPVPCRLWNNDNRTQTNLVVEPITYIFLLFLCTVHINYFAEYTLANSSTPHFLTQIGVANTIGKSGTRSKKGFFLANRITYKIA
jgi:hypothetical protein